jgi:hypothetical protein
VRLILGAQREKGPVDVVDDEELMAADPGERP